MAAKILLEVITPERLVLQEEVDMVVATAVEGEFGVLPGHAPMLCLLQTGPGRYKNNGKTQYMAIAGGIAEVFKDKVTILAEAVELAQEINVKRAMKARERALKRLSSKEKIDLARSEGALRRANVRLMVARYGGLIESSAPEKIEE
jgi:F-type H+-transporting ATPase subunit epsilon